MPTLPLTISALQFSLPFGVGVCLPANVFKDKSPSPFYCID